MLEYLVHTIASIQAYNFSSYEAFQSEEKLRSKFLHVLNILIHFFKSLKKKYLKPPYIYKGSLPKVFYKIGVWKFWITRNAHVVALQF